MPTIHDAITQLLVAKSHANCRPRYVNSLRQYLTLFAKGRETKEIREFSVSDLEAWFQSRNESITTQASNIGRLSALFSYSWRHDWISHNPCDRLERPRLDQKIPKILTVEESEDILHHTREHAPANLAWLVLNLLAGVRPEESLKLHWRDVDLDRGVVRIDASVSKVRRRRLVRLLPNARDWMTDAFHLSSVLPVNAQRRKRWLHHLRARLRFEVWPTDVLRHTAASFMLAITGDPSGTSMQLGNSPAILMRHYSEIVPREDAERFWAITPNKTKDGLQ